MPDANTLMRASNIVSAACDCSVCDGKGFLPAGACCEACDGSGRVWLYSDQERQTALALLEAAGIAPLAPRRT